MSIDIVRDTNGVVVNVGDKVIVPEVTGMLMELVNHPNRGLCLFSADSRVEIFMSLKEAQHQGMYIHNG